jgi:acetylornithine/succinyldiaminopimelate/putrescine aminotransferase
LAGACELYGITPDLAVYGKAIANGLPLGAIVGPREYMRRFELPSPVFCSSTGAGNAVSLAAADAVLDLLSDDVIDHIWHIGRSLLDGLREARYTVLGNPPRSLLQFESQSERGYFIRGMSARGVLMNRPNLPNLAHSQADVDLTVKAAVEVKREMETIDVAEAMAGKLPLQLFSGR